MEAAYIHALVHVELVSLRREQSLLGSTAASAAHVDSRSTVLKLLRRGPSQVRVKFVR